VHLRVAPRPQASWLLMVGSRVLTGPAETLREGGESRCHIWKSLAHTLNTLGARGQGMRRTLIVIVGSIVGLAAVALAAPGLALGIVACGATAGIVWVGSRCRHSGPLGLLPPVTVADGTHLPARWFCDSCGKAWPVGLSHDHTPVIKYVGYDQSKAPAAARRASDLERKTQELALRRAGITGARTSSARTAQHAAPAAPPVPTSSPTIVSINQVRRAAVK